MEHNAGTKPVAAQHAVDAQALAAYLEAGLEGFRGPLSIEQFKGGQSNPTYKLVTPARSYVMRSKPGPVAKLLPSAHAIEREFAVMRALAASEVPVARMHLLCEDESVIGRAFYVMEFVEGRVLWNQALPGMAPAERGALYDEMNRVIAALHRTDFRALGLEGYGKPGNYFERQIGRWTKQYQASLSPELEPIAAMDHLIDWLPAHIPDSARDAAQTSIVHGDYRLDNLIFHPTEPRILAVLDWELSTLGDPLVDFAYHCLPWHLRQPEGRSLVGADLAALGIPTEAAYRARYLERSGRGDTVSEADWTCYLVFNMFRLVGILQGVAKRAQQGNASNARAVEAGKRARPLAEQAWALAQTL